MRTVVSIFVLLILMADSFLNPALAGKARNPQSGNKPKYSLENQINKYIRQNEASFIYPKKGIVMISFSLDEKNQLSDVKSYSKISSLDQYLISRLNGKTIDIERSVLNTNNKQYLKIRFDIDNE